MRSNRQSSQLSDVLSLSGWIYADLLLGLMIIFMATVVGINPLKLVADSEASQTADAVAQLAELTPTTTDTPTPDMAATDAAAADLLATSVAATLTAIDTLTIESTSTPFPTPEPTDNLDATQTAIARQIVQALAATLTAAPTPTSTPTLRPTPNFRATRTALARGAATSVAATLTAAPTATVTDMPTDGPTPTPTATADIAATETAVADLIVQALAATLTAESPDREQALVQTVEAAIIATAFVATLTAEPLETRTPVPTLVTGLSGEPVRVVIQTNADLLLAEDAEELRQLRDQIQSSFAQYSNRREAGIVLTFGTSPNPNEGNTLSRSINELLVSELPSVFSNAVLNDYHTISANTNRRGEVEIEVYLVAE